MSALQLGWKLSRPAISAAPMALSAHDQMKEFWKKNEKLNRPSSPWIIYWPHLPMMTSLGHRTTGIVLGTGLYGISIGVFLAPGDFNSIIQGIQSLEIAAPIMCALKSIVAFPLVYHYINGLRHLSWDAGYGFKLNTQYKTGILAYGSAAAIALLLGSLSYW
ncbi:DgyrCDS13226 [Dimorphilus gyrociliatus]|uniref:DgyrCDS13226 n=1 Tax=Dimorphilus gyrociliatus TaxID=2664684 RepID=A0A7I8WA11_9ANNE|nr:DgyrCDS13226 [Dimorphilus gyrociliatus]